MSVDATTGETATADADPEPPSSEDAGSSRLEFVDRRTPGGSALSIAVDLDELRRVGRRLAEAVGTRFEIAVALLGDDEMDRLHREHSGVPGTTDVLSWPLDADDRSGVVRGDLAVGVEVAAREAAARGRALEAELMLYVVHGLLHLLGERDDTHARRSAMVVAQDRLLAAIGLPSTGEDSESAR